MPPEDLEQEEQPLSNTCMEGDAQWSPDTSNEQDKLCVAERRKSLRHMDLPRSILSPRKSSDESDDSRHLNRRQMKKDLHKLKRCMARTGAAAVAASVLTSPIDGVSNMDLASRFRRQHRPPIPELSPEVYVESEADFAMLDSQITSATVDKARPRRRRSFKECLLDDLDIGGSPTELSANISPGLTLAEWDQVSEMSEMGSEAGFQGDWETMSLAGSDISKIDVESFCAAEDSQLDFASCLRSVSRFRRPRAIHKYREWTYQCKDKLYEGVFEKDTEVLHGSEVGKNADKLKLGAAASGFLAVARSAAAQTTACYRGVVSKVASVLSAAPPHVAGNFASLSEVRLATLRAVRGDAEERHAARIFLCCTLGFLVLVWLSCATMALVVMAFVEAPDSPTPGRERVSNTGLLDAGSNPKSISRVLTVVMISLFAGNGLAMSHPMRDAILAGL